MSPKPGSRRAATLSASARYMSVMNQAKSAATALGYQVASYTNFVVCFPNDSWRAGSDCNGYAWPHVRAPSAAVQFAVEPGSVAADGRRDS